MRFLETRRLLFSMIYWYTLYVSFWSQLSDIAQIIFFDMRGHGRSDLNNAANWTLTQWGRDVAEFCDNLGLNNPIIAGFSFGGWVALSYAIQFPDHPSKLILCNTEAKVDFQARIAAYRKKGGAKVAAIVEKLAYEPDEKTEQQYIEHCIPLFCEHPYTDQELNRCFRRTQVWNRFDQNEYRTFDFLPELDKIHCPTLVLAGTEDPEHPPTSAKKMVTALSNCETEYALIRDAGDPVYRDKPTETLRIIKKFLK